MPSDIKKSGMLLGDPAKVLSSPNLWSRHVTFVSGRRTPEPGVSVKGCNGGGHARQIRTGRCPNVSILSAAARGAGQ